MRVLNTFFKQDLEQQDGNAWGMIDIMTLLLVFFIILYVQEMPGQDGPSQSAAPSAAAMTAAGVNPPNQGPATAALIRQHFDHQTGPGFYLTSGPEHATLVLEEQLAFAPGEAGLQAEARPVLASVVAFLNAEPGYRVFVSGHTDDLPISNQRFSSNWQLAAGRAAVVAEYLAAHQVDPARLTTQGFAEFRPLFPNDSPNNRRRNRRVEIAFLRH